MTNSEGGFSSRAPFFSEGSSSRRLPAKDAEARLLPSHKITNNSRSTLTSWGKVRHPGATLFAECAFVYVASSPLQRSFARGRPGAAAGRPQRHAGRGRRHWLLDAELRERLT